LSPKQGGLISLKYLTLWLLAWSKLKDNSQMTATNEQQDQPDVTQNAAEPITKAAAPTWQQPYLSTSTFSRLPFVAQPTADEADIAIMGIPWDGLVTHRPGARFGPREIRQASVACRSYSSHMDVSVYEQARVVDVGDVDIANFDYQETFARIESKAFDLHSKGISLVSLGGDHSVLLPLLRAMFRQHGTFTLIQFDAHTDTSATEGTPQYHHGTCVRNAIEEGLIEGSGIFQIGIRGSFGSASYLDYGKQNGINVLDMHDFHHRERRNAFVAKLRETAGTNPCYVTFDIDGIDPAYAPGTGTPVPGGLTSFEAIDMLRELRGLRVLGGDVVEVAPAYDNHAQITSLLGATLALQITALIAICQQNDK
jgi:agmatinase